MLKAGRDDGNFDFFLQAVVDHRAENHVDFRIEAAEIVIAASDPEVNMIFGAMIDDSLKEEIKVTVIATGFEHKGPTRRPVNPSAAATQTQAQPDLTGGHSNENRQTNNLRPFGNQNVSSDQLDIPAFLRNRPRGDR